MLKANRKDEGIISDKKSSIDNRPLYGMFSKVPGKYDFLNRLFTVGMDQRWRRMAAEVCFKGNPPRIMDLCSGTGDLAIELAIGGSKETDLISVDFCEPMLEIAKRKAADAGLRNRIMFQVADAAGLPFDDNYFDVVGIAFGFRNLIFKNPHSKLYLNEILRVISPGGRLVIVETSQPYSKLLRLLFNYYLSLFVAPVGSAVSRHSGAYRYLAHSAKNFLGPSEVSNLLLGSGFASVDYTLLWGGIAAIHVAATPS
jgi:demethylmenaquinone methyltransferase/2-methoxy-6-polyprenyl-1,4-benzoquinol methylase